MASSFLDENNCYVSLLLLRDVGLYVMGQGENGETKVVAQSTHIEVETKPSYNRQYRQVSIEGKKFNVMKAVLKLMEMIHSYQIRHKFKKCPLRLILKSSVHELSQLLCSYEALEENNSTGIVVEDGWIWHPVYADASIPEQRHAIVNIYGDAKDIDGTFNEIVKCYQTMEEILNYHKKADVKLCISLHNGSFDIKNNIMLHPQKKKAISVDASVNTEEIKLSINPEIIQRSSLDETMSTLAILPANNTVAEFAVINPESLFKPTELSLASSSSVAVDSPGKKMLESGKEEMTAHQNVEGMENAADKTAVKIPTLISTSKGPRNKARRPLLKIVDAKVNRVPPKKLNSVEKREPLNKQAGDTASSALEIKRSLNGEGKQSEVLNDDDSRASENTPFHS